MSRPSIFLLIQLFLSTIAYGQEMVTIFLNSRLEITNNEKASCKCQAEYDMDNFRLNGIIKCVSLNELPRLEIVYKNGLKNGPAKFYTTTGQLIFTGYYENNLRSGLWKYYYSNGNLMQTIKFTSDTKSRNVDANIMIGEYFDKKGVQLVKNGNGIWSYDSIFSSWADNESRKIVKGSVKDSLKHGAWELRRVNQKKSLHIEKFDKGQFVTGHVLVERDGEYGTMPYELTQKFPDNYKDLFYNFETLQLDSTAFSESIRSLGTEQLIEAITGVKYKIRTRSAGYMYGDFELMEYISSNIQYPKEAKQSGHQGTVIVQLTIDKNGKARDIKVLKGVHDSLNAEAIRVISSVNDWVSGLHDGQPYEKTIAIPVRFQL